MPLSHTLFEWSWHHFAPLSIEANFVPILEVLADHEGEEVSDARDDINRDVEALGLSVGLGGRDIIRDRSDVWRFTGVLQEPGLADNEIRLTSLGEAVVNATINFDEAMAWQAARLQFPRVRVRTTTDLSTAVDQLREALGIGPGVRVAEAWAVGVAYLREWGSRAAITGEEAAQFLSGCASINQVPERAEAIRATRTQQPLPGFPVVSSDKRRQGRELMNWLKANGALVDPAEAPVFIDPPVEPPFEFGGSSEAEIRRWADWWGSTP
jgi:hypothetical protein